MPVTIEELKKQLDAQNQELNELKKAQDMMVADKSPKSMQITYSQDLQTKVFEKAPYFRFLESKGRVSDVGSSYVAFYIEQDNSAAQFILENDDIPDAISSRYTEETTKMKTIIHPIDVGLMAQMGNQQIDLLGREIEKGYIKIANITDDTLLQGTGDGTGSTKTFAGFTKQVPSENTVTMNKGEPLSEDIIEELLVQLIDQNGANIDCLVTTYGVGKLLKKMVAPYRRYNDKIDINLGHRVIGYESITGADIPILIDSNLNTDCIMCVDSSSIEVKRLMAPTVFDNLPTNKLGTRKAIVSFVTAQNVASFKDGLITGIDTTVDPIISCCGSSNSSSSSSGGAGDGANDDVKYTIGVTVKDSSSNPIEGASVALDDTYTGTTGSAGGCNLKDVPAGTYTLTVSKSDYTTYTQSVTVSQSTTLDVTLTAS